MIWWYVVPIAVVAGILFLGRPLPLRKGERNTRPDHPVRSETPEATNERDGPG